jgi:hypothetical protein
MEEKSFITLGPEQGEYLWSEASFTWKVMTYSNVNIIHKYKTEYFQINWLIHA